MESLTSNKVNTHVEISLLRLWLLACRCLDRLYGVRALLLDVVCFLDRCGGILNVVEWFRMTMSEPEHYFDLTVFQCSRFIWQLCSRSPISYLLLPEVGKFKNHLWSDSCRAASALERVSPYFDKINTIPLDFISS